MEYILIGSAFLGIVVLIAGARIANAIFAVAEAVNKLVKAQSTAESGAAIEQSLNSLAENVESLHRRFGGRLWKTDELDLDGPTIQSLLRSIANSLKKMTAERPNILER